MFRALTAGSFGIGQNQRGDESLLVRRNGLTVFFQALHVPGDGVPRHVLCLCQRSPVRYAARQCRDHGGESALGLWAEDDVEVQPSVLRWHGFILSGPATFGRHLSGRLLTCPALPVLA